MSTHDSAEIHTRYPHRNSWGDDPLDGNRPLATFDAGAGVR